MNVSRNMALVPANDEAPDELELIGRTLAGDERAFAMIVERFQRRIFRIAWSVVRDDAEADSVAQDTFVQAYTSLGRFEGRSSLETWLTRIAINKARDTLRRRRFVSLFGLGDDGQETVLAEPADERPGPEQELMASQIRLAIARAERTLSPQQKTIFRLRHHENLSLEEIAGHLGLRPATARVHLFRAVNKIRKELAAWRVRPAGTTS